MDRRQNYYLNITRSLLIAFFCLSVLPIFGLALVMKSAVEDTNISKLGELAAGTVAHRGELISQFLEEKENLLNMLVGLHPDEFMLNQKNIETLFLAMKSRGDIVDLQVIDATGKQLAYVGPYRDKIEGKRYDTATWFKETLISGVHISDLFAGYRGVPHFVVAVTSPLKTYVLRATINSSMFNSLLHSAQLGPHGDVFIVNRYGQFQTPSLLGADEISDELDTLLANEGAQQLVTSENIYTTHWIAHHRWVLVLKANIDDSLGYYLKVRDKIILVMMAIASIAMLGATVTSVMLSRRLQHADKEHTSMHLQFAQVEKMATVGRLAAGIAHEINNPLQMITNQAGWIGELLEDENQAQVKNHGEYLKSVEQIKYHVRRAGTITHRLLGFSRKISTQNGQVQINELLQETISFVEKEADYNNIRITRELSDNLPATLTDGPQLQQVFLNLLNNAVDAVGKDGEVMVRSRLAASGQLQVEIADSGPGIKAEYLKQIFDPFFTTKEPGKGTGLGLYISYDIVRKLGGTMEASNQKSGGAIFTVQLPVMVYGQA